MSQLHTSPSTHSATVNPTLYLGLMKSYMSRVLKHTCATRGLQVKTGALYGNIVYPTLSAASCQLYALLLTSTDDAQAMPNITLNTGVKSWLKNISAGTDGVIDAVVKNSALRIKYPRTDDETAQERGLFEYFIGTLMNKMRKKMPHFVYTLGAFKCSPLSLRSSSLVAGEGVGGRMPAAPVETFCSSQEHTVYHIVQEKVQGVTFDAWLQQTPTARGFYTTLLHLAFALQKAQDKKGFMHNALYASNVILRPSEIGTVTFQFGSQVFQMGVEKEGIPTVIDYSSARATHKGFGICYLSNPTIFIPGKDLCKLVASALARINATPLYTEVAWVNEFFHSHYNVSDGPYDEIKARYDGFDLSDDNPLASLTPMDFVNWFRTRNGELFNQLVTVKAREIRELHLSGKRSKSEVDPDLRNIPSGIMKTYALAEYGVKYTPTGSEESYDRTLAGIYSKDIYSSMSTPVYSVCYNFPLNIQYQGDKRVDFPKVLQKLESDHQVAANYILLVRYAKTVSMQLPGTEADLQRGLVAKDRIKYNVNVISNLPLYRLYQIAMAISLEVISGQTLTYFGDLHIASEWVKQLYPSCADYLDSTFLPEAESTKLNNVRLVDLTRDASVPAYYPSCTLVQLSQLRHEKQQVLALARKIFFGWGDDSRVKDLESVLFQSEADDAKILLDLRQFHTPAEFDRSKSRVKDLAKLLPHIPQKKFASYLDFGGGDGAISSAIAGALQVGKQHAYSADVDKWFERSVPKTYPGITYITLKEGQPIPLPDKSIDVVTCFQVLHHIKNIDFTLSELRRVCKYVLIIREHDCQTDAQRMLIDLEHSMYELSVEPNPKVKFLNDYEAFYLSKDQWKNRLEKYGFITIYSSKPSGPTRYYYAVMKME